MARKSKKSEIIFIIVIVILLTALGLGIISYFYFDKKIEEKEKNNNKIITETQSKEEILKSKEEEMIILQNELDEYNNLDKKIEDLKKEYYSSIKDLEDAIISGKSNKKIAYLTFDDGPYYNTYKVLDILDKYNVKATFFTTSINGENCYDKKSEKCYPLYKEYIKRGHTIANHTYTHGIWSGLYKSTDSFINAVSKQEEHVKNMTGGYITRIVRFPGGSSTAGKLKNSIIEALKKKGYGWVDWNAQDGDGGDLSTKEQAWSNLKSSINENIEVILFHDYHPITTEILPEVIEYLQKNGYILLPLFYESNMINK